jgi:N-acetylneuraminate synthase
VSGRYFGENDLFVIAEMSGNHNGSLDRALEIVAAAGDSGASAIKLQTYTPDTMTLNSDLPHFKISDPKSLWYGRKLYDLYSEAATPWEWHEAIFSKARELGLVPFSTPFDVTSVEFLEKLDVGLYKIASFENTDLPLIAEVAKTGKPMIISIGLATLEEIEEAVSTAQANGCKEYALLKTTSAYPAEPHEANLATISKLKDHFGCTVGISDHTLGIGVAIAAVALGASVIEKHLTLDRHDGGVDSAFSTTPQEFKALVIESTSALNSRGSVTFGPTERERESLVFRRSIFFVRDLEAGSTVSAQDLRVLRPGIGLAPKHLSKVVGQKLTRNVFGGEPVLAADLSEFTLE